MNVQRFTGRTNRLALEQVRNVMGPEALILSNKRTADGIEICAMLESGSVRSAIEQAAPAASSSGSATNEIALAHLKRELTDLRETLHAALAAVAGQCWKASSHSNDRAAPFNIGP